MATAQSIQFETRDQGEETARADLYGLLAALLYAPPLQSLLDTIAGAPVRDGNILENAWSEVVAMCKTMQQESVREEYEELFVGTGKPEVMLYGSYYLSGFLMEKPLAELRSDLAKLGLQRADNVVESEDHLASLCEVMRYLIASDDVLNANLQAQKQFFTTHMQGWVADCCSAVEASPNAIFYKPVARLAHAFFEVEMQAFDMT